MDLLFQRDEKTNPPTDLHDLQELQCFLMVHIAQNECKSKFLMCILQNELRWVIIAHMFYLFKRPLWENNKDTLPRLPSVSLRAQDAEASLGRGSLKCSEREESWLLSLRDLETEEGPFRRRGSIRHYSAVICL